MNLTPKQPTFSIIVPTFGRPQQLATCLRSLAGLDYPRDCFEVLVVDDGNTTPPESIIHSFRYQLKIRLLSQSHAGPAAARNTGAAQAKAQFLAFTDDDCTVSTNWLQTLAARFTKLPHCTIGGRVQNALPENTYSTASQLLVSYLYTYYNVEPDRARFLTSNNLAVPKELFHTVGGFDALWMHAAGEDREFCDRWLFYGHRLVHAPEVLVFHAHPLTLRTFWWQHFTYGQGAYYFHSVRAQRTQEGIKVEPLRFYWRLLQYPFSQGECRRGPTLASLLVIAQSANVVGFFWERKAGRTYTQKSIAYYTRTSKAQ